MANQQNSYTGSQGSGTNSAEFDFTFPTFKESEIRVEVDNVVKTVTTHYTIQNYNSTSGGKVRFTTNNIPTGTTPVRIFRQTDIETAKATFTSGASLKAEELNANFKQVRHALQETIGANATDRKVQRFNIEADSIDGTLIADDVIDSEHYAAGSIDLEHMSANSVDSDQYVDGSIDRVHLEADIIDSTKLADNAVNSEHYVDGSIEHVHLANDIIDGDNIANDSINSEHYAAGSIDHEHLANDIIDGDNIQDNAVNSEHYVDGSIDRVHLEADIIDSTKLADNAVGAEHIQTNAVTDSEIATGTLDNRYFTEAELNGGQLNNLYFTESEITGGAADGRYYTETELDAGKLDNRYFTETELTAGALDGRYYTETEAEALFLRQDSSETIASGTTWSNADNKVATTAAINARIIDLIDDVGGFTVIANEGSFPNSNPQGTAGQAAILSIGAVTTTLTPTNGTVTLANGRVNNGQVLITGVTSAIPQGFGLLVESTSTDHTYAFHRLVPKATEVTTVASNITNIVAAGTNVADINNFADIYQISNSAPTQRADGTSLQDGDLWFDNSNDNLRVYDGSNWAIITPAQSVLDDIAIVSGVITYSEDLGLISDAVTTGSSNGSLDIVADTLEDEITFTVTAATGKFIIDGVDKPALTLYKGWTYTFDLSHTSNATHPFRFQSGGSAYNTNVTVTGTQGQAGAKIVIKIPESQPTSFQYYCTAHSGMGNTITVKDDPIKTVSDGITNINAVANNSTNINAVAGNATNINTVASSESNINRYADEYVIQSGTPSSPSAGDLWFSTTSNILNFYNGSAWVGISPGIAGLINDSNPQLANHLDCNDKNLTEVATISGDNLQLDFGTI